MPRASRFAALLLAAALLAATVPQAAAGRGLLQAAPAAPQAADHNPVDPTNIANQYIVEFKAGVKAKDAPGLRDAIAKRNAGVKVVFDYDEVFTGFAFALPATASAAAREAVLKNVRGDANVLSVTPDAPVSAFGTLAAGEAPDNGVVRIGAVAGTTAKNAAGVAVAVIDTGVQLTHPDLNAVNGYNCINTRNTANDDNGHGTHCAGTIAARNSGAGVVGVAPGTKVVAVKVLDYRGSGSFSSIVCGLNWVAKNAAAQGIRVASMSLGGSGTSAASCATATDSLQKAVCAVLARNITVVAAAGNSNVNLATQVPAAYPGVLTVTAMADSDGRAGGVGGATTCYAAADDSAASFSNWATSTDAAAQAHTIAAPGVCIRSTYLQSGYTVMSGTSMATPHVAGTVALCINNGGVAGPCARLAPDGVISRLLSDAQAHAAASADSFAGDPSKPISGRYYGYLAWAGGY